MAKAYFEEIQCKTLINRVQGGMPFRWTINPYRGCQHACIYCFARSTHQYLPAAVGSSTRATTSTSVSCYNAGARL